MPLHISVGDQNVKNTKINFFASKKKNEILFFLPEISKLFPKNVKIFEIFPSYALSDKQNLEYIKLCHFLSALMIQMSKIEHKKKFFVENFAKIQIQCCFFP